MKKITLAIAAFAALALASCGGQTKAGDNVDSTEVVEKSFEQEQVEAAIKMHVDSLVAQMNEKDFKGVGERFKNGEVKLTADDKKVKPTYLLAPAVSEETATVAQKYSTLAMLFVDSQVAKAYDMDTEAYDAAISKLITEVNDPAFKKATDLDGDAKAKSDLLYKEMDKEGRINFYWIATSAFALEDIYILTQNVEKHLEGYTDAQVEAITFRLFCILDALDQLSTYDPQIPGIAEALSPLKKLDAVTVADFKKQLEEAKEEIEASRAAFLK